MGKSSVNDELLKEAHPGGVSGFCRRRWKWLLGATILVLALVCVGLVLATQLNKSDSSPAPSPNETPTAQTYSTTADIADCKIKVLAFKHAEQLLGVAGTGDLVAVYKSLKLDNCPDVPFPVNMRPHMNVSVPADTLFVDCAAGSDLNKGTLLSPLRTIPKALMLASGGGAAVRSTIIVRAGICYLTSSLNIGPNLNGLTLAAYPGEKVTISGGVQIQNLTWTPYKDGIYVASLERSGAPANFDSLYVNGKRAVRAKYPNGDPEYCGANTTCWTLCASFGPPKRRPATLEQIEVKEPARTGTKFPTYRMAFGGAAEIFANNQSYWAQKYPIAGQTFVLPSSMKWFPDKFTTNKWANPETGIVHIIRDPRWASWQFAIDSVDYRTNTINLGEGGFQEARGGTSGRVFYVENIFEELDTPGEWFLDSKDNKLYYYPVDDTEMSSNSTFEASYVEMLLKVMGTDAKDNVVSNITIQGFTFAGTIPTYMMAYEVPSAGDWTIHRGGAVFVENSTDVTIQDSMFEFLGGNAVFLSNYNRGTKVQYNEFRYIGDSAVVAVGYVELNDGTNGLQPRDALVHGNMMYELGVYGKQSAGYFQSLACANNITNNIIFSSPRGGIIFNDGFGGGNYIVNNLMFNLVRETGDHGPFNSWDRLPYLTEMYDGKTPSVVPAETYITSNFILGNYHTVWTIDHDDGSSYYTDTNNVLVYGGTKNYLGYSKVVSKNLMVYPDFPRTEYPVLGADDSFFDMKPYCAYTSRGHDPLNQYQYVGEQYTSNRCVMWNTTQVYSFVKCNITTADNILFTVPFTADNEFYVPNGQITAGFCSMNYTLYDLQTKINLDLGSTQQNAPDTDTVVGWAAEMLNISLD